MKPVLGGMFVNCWAGSSFRSFFVSGFLLFRFKFVSDFELRISDFPLDRAVLPPTRRPEDAFIADDIDGDEVGSERFWYILNRVMWSLRPRDFPSQL